MLDPLVFGQSKRIYNRCSICNEEIIVILDGDGKVQLHHDYVPYSVADVWHKPALSVAEFNAKGMKTSSGTLVTPDEIDLVTKALRALADEIDQEKQNGPDKIRPAVSDS